MKLARGSTAIGGQLLTLSWLLLFPTSCSHINIISIYDCQRMLHVPHPRPHWCYSTGSARFSFQCIFSLHSSCLRCMHRPIGSQSIRYSSTTAERIMVKAPDQVPAPGVSADAAPAQGMQYHGGRSRIPAADDAVHILEPTNRENNPLHSVKSPYSLSTENLKAHAIAQSTPPLETDQQPQDTDTKEGYPAHQVALRRLNGTVSANKHNIATSESGSTTSTQPVLVRSYPTPRPTSNSSQAAAMKRKQKPTADTNTYDLPPLESFSFQDILASIDPEIRASIDTIAEICGRSKMSLADEYDSHLPPQGQLHPLREQSNPPEMAALSRLEPVEEASRSRHAQRHSFALASTSSNRAPLALSSSPVAATSNITSQPRSPPQSPANTLQLSGSCSDQIMAWLRGSTSRIESLQIRDSSAADALHRILGENRSSMASL
jgi:hypothetical protein